MPPSLHMPVLFEQVYRVILPNTGSTVGYVKADLQRRYRFPESVPLDILRDGVQLEDTQPLQ